MVGNVSLNPELEGTQVIGFLEVLVGRVQALG